MKIPINSAVMYVYFPQFFSLIWHVSTQCQLNNFIRLWNDPSLSQPSWPQHISRELIHLTVQCNALLSSFFWIFWFVFRFFLEIIPRNSRPIKSFGFVVYRVLSELFYGLKHLPIQLDHNLSKAQESENLATERLESLA